MATSPTGYQACYQPPKEHPRRKRIRPVIRWDGDGNAMVVDEQQGKLVPAADIDGFKYLQGTHAPVVAALPPAGWKLAYEQDNGEGDVIDELIGWAVHSDGFLTPIVPESCYGSPIFDNTVLNRVRLIPPQSTGTLFAGQIGTAIADRIRKGKEPREQPEAAQV